MAKEPEDTTNIVSSEQLSTQRPPWEPPVYAAADEIVKYIEMIEKDPVAGQALRFSSNVVINLIGEFDHPDENIRDFVRMALRQTRGGYRALLRWLLRAPVTGYQAAEKVYGKVEFGRRQLWGYDAFPRIPAQSLAYNGIKMDKALGQPRELVQWEQYGAGGITIPGAKVVHWAYEDKGDGYGTPLGKGLLPLYDAKQQVEKMCVTGIEKIGQKLLYERVPSEKFEIGEPPKSYAEAVQESWKKSSGGSTHVRPVKAEWAENNLPSLEVLDAGGFQQDFLAFIDYVNRTYFLTVGIPALVMMEAEHATRAQTVVQSDAAKFTLLPLAQEFAEVCLMRDIVHPLIEINFGEQDEYGEFPVTIPTDEAYIAALLKTFYDAGVLAMMVPEPVYDKIQALFPDILPPREEE